MQKSILLYLILIFTACNSPNESTPKVEVEEPVEYEKNSIEKQSEKEVPLTVTDFEEKKPVFEPSTEERAKYLFIKKEVINNKEVFRKHIYPITPRNIQALQSTTSGTLKEMAQTMEHYSINEYITMRQIDNAQFNRELNQVGTALSYCLIKDFGESKDQGKLISLKSKIQELNSMNLITDYETVQAKLFEAELNSKATFTDPNMKIQIGDDGKVYIKQ